MRSVVCTERPDFAATLRAHGIDELRRAVPTTLQINVGRLCNQACHHCHVEAGPNRPERMQMEVAERVIALLKNSPQVQTVDITGGAPELNECFRYLVRSARGLGREVIDRCNLTVLFEPGQEDTAEFLAAHQVHIIASLPCYTKENVERQRGRGVFGRSIAALRKLNDLGYGCGDEARQLDLVYNPLGAFLPPPQAELEARYRRELEQLFGVRFDRLLTLTNMPIRRFARDLARQGRESEYMSLLVAHFNAATVGGLMCRHLVSVGYRGELFDCDFNQMLDMPLGGRRRTIWDVEDLAELAGEPVATASHCFGCTAGAGSSCGGSLA